MTKLKRILKDYSESGAMNALVNVHVAIDDHTFLTKSGGVFVILSLLGADYECQEASWIDQITRQFESGLRNLDEHFRLYQYIVKRNGPAIPTGEYDNPVVREAVSSRKTYFEAKADSLYSFEIYFAVVYEGWDSDQKFRGRLANFLRKPVSQLRGTFSNDALIDGLKEGVERAAELLANKVMSFVVQLPEAVRAEILDKQQAFGFLRQLLNYAPYKIEGVRLKYDRYVDFQACDSELECHRDHLRLDDSYVQALSVKEPPSQTFAHILRGLQDIPCNLIIASEWKRESNAKVHSLIQSKRRHFHNSKSSLMNYVSTGAQTQPKDMLIDDAALSLVSDLGSCLQELEVKGRYFGEFSMTVVLYHSDRSLLRRAVAECFKVFAVHDAQLIEERYNLLNAWLAIIPGNSAYNLRRFWLLDSNYADLSFLFTLHAGERTNTHLGAEYLAVVETNHYSPYFLNLHYQDIAHTIILGTTGSGKSFLLNFLLTHLQKYAPFTYIFDLGGSYENLTRLFNGAYLPIGLEKRPFKINPFSLPFTKENHHFLFSFLKVLMESGDRPITSQEERDLFEQIENLYVIDADQRRLLTFSNMLNRNLRARLYKWVEGGPYASFFDNVEDNLTLSRFQTFDFEGMDKVPDLLEPALFYILHRASAAINSEESLTTLKIFVIDEAWRFFRHPTIKLYILEALKTWRKKNGAMILSTQSSDDLLRSEVLSVVVESCPTKMFLANPDMDAKLYREVFHLNETEADLITRLIPKKQVLVKRPDMARVINLNVDRKDYWLYTSSPADRERRSEAFARYGFEQGLEILSRSNPT